ncbi:haloacid dehalogenase [Sulfurovum sp.]|uniref:HAD family hydrolase n=1 Tax=Sulfurovum sp. TaxID=1969726 RepID=UPI0025E6FDBA|nr:haloacid dehalogenase [Sulfurovum sp.]
MIEIPHFKNLEIENILFDYNGTLATDGHLKPETGLLLKEVCQSYRVYVITADTFGTVKEALKAFDLEVLILSSDDHTREKAAFLASLGTEITVTLGNGNNDAKMIKDAVLSIAILGDEGCSAETLNASDIVCKDIGSAMELLLSPKRLIATLRR